MEPNDYVNRLRHAMEISENPRFSPEYIAQCCTYAENLLKQGLPVLFDQTHIRKVLGMAAPRLCDYHRFTIPKHNGSRIITAPSRKLKLRQQWIYQNILIRKEASPYTHGFVPERSIVTNAILHIGYAYTYCVDITDFFPSITKKQVLPIFRNMGYSGSAANTLCDLCCCDGVLPQGAPTSPYLSNMICRDLDDELGAMARRFRGIFTRYADDIAISTNQQQPQLLDALGLILGKHGFLMNLDKCRVYNPGQPKRITGLTVHNRVSVPKTFKRKLRQEIHCCQKFGVTAHLENTKAARSIHYREHLYGKAYYVKMVEPELGAHFLDELSKVDWPE